MHLFLTLSHHVRYTISGDGDTKKRHVERRGANYRTYLQHLTRDTRDYHPQVMARAIHADRWNKVNRNLRTKVINHQKLT
jgi:hypothetical protein